MTEIKPTVNQFDIGTTGDVQEDGEVHIKKLNKFNIFAIGDTHLSMDPGIDKPMDEFGPEWKNHAERLYENWHREISDEDYVIVAGDISWGLRMEEAMADLDWIHELPGQKLIFKGNHDLWWQSIGKLNKLYLDEEGNQKGSMMHFVQNSCFMIPDTGVAICGTRGWTCPGTEGFGEHDRAIYERELIRLRFGLEDAREKGAEEIIAVLHFPPTNDKQQPSGFTQLMEEYGVKQCVYGHLHSPQVHKHGLKGVLNGVEYKLIALDYLGAEPLKIREI